MRRVIRYSITRTFIAMGWRRKSSDRCSRKFRPSQVTALQKACPMPLVVNQIEISLANLTSFEDGTLDQCLAEKITPMAWSPLAGGQLADGATRLLPSQQSYRIKPIIAALDV